MFAVRAALSYDGVSSSLSGPVQVVVDDATIVSVGPPAPVADDVEIVDLGDVTLLPGLVDAHTHLTWNAAEDAVARVTNDDDDALLAQARAAAARALKVGITTVRDLGDRGYLTLRLRDEWKQTPEAGPHIVAAGPPITTRGGHCWFLAGEAESDAELRRAVQQRAERGVDVIKVMATGGNMTPHCPPHQSQYGPAQLRLLADEAHKLGLPITAHAHGAEGAVDAVDSGFDALEHAGHWTATSAEITRRQLDELARRRCMVVTTPALRGVPRPDAYPPLIAARLDAMREVFTAMRSAGVRMAYASDAGIGPVKDHDVLAHALPAAVHSGWHPLEVLRAMTSRAAEACSLETSKGRIAVGYDADLLAVAGDPADNPEALADTRAVLRAGRFVVGPMTSDEGGRLPRHDQH